MFIGKRPIKSFRHGGTFFCPQCYQQRQFRWQVIHQYATLMMVPIYPASSPEHSVECMTCKAVFSDAILDYSPDEADRQFAAEVFRINVLIAMAEERLEPVEIAEIQRLHEELTGARPTREAIEDEVRQAYEDPLDAAEMVRRVGRSLGGEGARIVAQHAYQVATASGRVSEKRQAQLDQFPAGLGISAAGFQQLIDEIAPPEKPGRTSPKPPDQETQDEETPVDSEPPS